MSEIKIFKIFIILSILWVGSGCIKVECNYGRDDYSDYCCKVQNSIFVTLKDDREITEVSGDHREGKTNDDVDCFYANGGTVNFVPLNITKFFKNVKVLDMYSTTLQEITKEDLRQFGDKLTVLHLGITRVKALESNLFQFNKNLVKIYLHGNKIEKIESGAFKGLEKLGTLTFEGNPCTTIERDEDAHDNHQKAQELIKRLENECKDRNFVPTTEAATSTISKPSTSTILNILSTTQKVQTSLETSSQDQKDESQFFIVILIVLILLALVLLSAIYILYRWGRKSQMRTKAVQISLIEED